MRRKQFTETSVKLPSRAVLPLQAPVLSETNHGAETVSHSGRRRTRSVEFAKQQRVFSPLRSPNCRFCRCGATCRRHGRVAFSRLGNRKHAPICRDTKPVDAQKKKGEREQETHQQSASSVRGQPPAPSAPAAARRRRRWPRVDHESIQLCISAGGNCAIVCTQMMLALAPSAAPSRCGTRNRSRRLLAFPGGLLARAA